MSKAEIRALQIMQRVSVSSKTEDLNDYPKTTLKFVKSNLYKYPSLALFGSKLLIKNQRLKQAVKRIITQNRCAANKWASIVYKIVLLNIFKDFKMQYHIGEERTANGSIESCAAAKADAHIWQAFPTIATFHVST
jgi:hypothetical protein